MTERDKAIVELTKQGLSARKVRARLKLHISSRQVQRIAGQHIVMKLNNNSADNAITPAMLPMIEHCLALRGLDRYECGICGERQRNKCDIHHTKYEGATVYDLMYACRSCNLARVNVGLA